MKGINISEPSVVGKPSTSNTALASKVLPDSSIAIAFGVLVPGT